MFMKCHIFSNFDQIKTINEIFLVKDGMKYSS
jgi:hypothetical protein